MSLMLHYGSICPLARAMDAVYSAAVPLAYAGKPPLQRL